MPQASAETLKAWPHDDRKAYTLLEENFGEKGGWYYPKVVGYQPTAEEQAAINYLVEEWDYGYTAVDPS